MDGEGRKGLRRRTLGRNRVAGKKAIVEYGISRHYYGCPENQIIKKKQEQKKVENYKKRRSDRSDLGGYVSENSEDEEEYNKRLKELKQEYGFSLSSEILDYMAKRNITDVMKTPYWSIIQREEKSIEQNEEELNYNVSEEGDPFYEEDYESEEEIEVDNKQTNKKSNKFDE